MQQQQPKISWKKSNQKGFEEVSLAFNYPIDPMTKQKSVLVFFQIRQRILKTGELILKESLNKGDAYQNVRLYRASDKDTSSVTASVISTDNGKTGTFNQEQKARINPNIIFRQMGLSNGDETFDALATFDGSKDSGYKNSRERHKRI